MKELVRLVLATALTLGGVGTAFAYVGPGAGLSLLGAVWALLAAVVAALLFVLMWPLRRMFKKGRAKRKDPSFSQRHGEAHPESRTPS